MKHRDYQWNHFARFSTRQTIRNPCQWGFANQLFCDNDNDTTPQRRRPDGNSEVGQSTKTWSTHTRVYLWLCYIYIYIYTFTCKVISGGGGVCGDRFVYTHTSCFDYFLTGEITYYERWWRWWSRGAGVCVNVRLSLNWSVESTEAETRSSKTIKYDGENLDFSSYPMTNFLFFFFYHKVAIVRCKTTLIWREKTTTIISVDAIHTHIRVAVAIVVVKLVHNNTVIIINTYDTIPIISVSRG